ncbi:hypothetical protein SLA2020_440440 [Shorea laevis]
MGWANEIASGLAAHATLIDLGLSLATPLPCKVAWHTYTHHMLKPVAWYVMLAELSLSVEPTSNSHLRTKSSLRRHMAEPLLVLS